jgi:ribosomal protein S18 acetylase RimI-like enzyme
MQTIDITKMEKAAINDAVELITVAMNKDEGQWAKNTMEFHFNSLEQGMDDGRDYYLWWKEKKAKGIVGLHRYIWGPPENVWLAWFAVSPELQGNGYGIKLLNSMFKKAKELAYRKFFVETYMHPDFEKAIKFYKKYGFTEAGKINNYLPDGSEMLVLYKEIV